MELHTISGTKLEHGKVKFYLPDKKYGFLYVLDDSGQATGEEIHFRETERQHLKCDGVYVEFCGAHREAVIKGIPVKFKLKKPEKDDLVVFTRLPFIQGSARKVSAMPWSYLSIAQRCQQTIEQLPTYRVRKSGQNYSAPPYDKVVWQGRDVYALSAALPRKSGKLADSLTDGSADGGDMFWHYSLEVQQPDGSWKSSWDNDPRVFACCVPPTIFSRHKRTPGLKQERCIH